MMARNASRSEMIDLSSNVRLRGLWETYGTSQMPAECRQFLLRLLWINLKTRPMHKNFLVPSLSETRRGRRAFHSLRRIPFLIIQLLCTTPQKSRCGSNRSSENHHQGLKSENLHQVRRNENRRLSSFLAQKVEMHQTIMESKIRPL